MRQPAQRGGGCPRCRVRSGEYPVDHSRIPHERGPAAHRDVVEPGRGDRSRAASDGLQPDALVFAGTRRAALTGAALTKMLVLAGHGDATVHGTARAGFKTWCDECTSFRDAVSEACLAHIEGDKVKAAYARGEFERQRRELMETWSRFCASRPVDDANKVVPLRPTA
jgi:hypothetical protein